MLSTSPMSKRAYGYIAGRLNRSATSWTSRPTTGILTHAGRHVEVDGRPSTSGRDEHHPRVGIDDDRMPDGVEHRRVVEAVGVRPALVEVDTVRVGPLRDRRELSGRPDERAVEGPVVVAVVVDGVAGGHGVVESERVGKRLDEVVRRGGGQHDRPAGLTMGRRRRSRRTVAPARRVGRRRFRPPREPPPPDRPFASATPWRAIAIAGSVSPIRWNSPNRNFSPGNGPFDSPARCIASEKISPTRPPARSDRDRRTQHPEPWSNLDDVEASRRTRPEASATCVTRWRRTDACRRAKREVSGARKRERPGLGDPGLST